MQEPSAVRRATAQAAPRRPLGLKAHLLALFVALLIPSLGLGSVVAWRAVEAYRHGFETRLEWTARALGLAINQEIAGFESMLAGLSTSRLLDEGATAADLALFHARAREVAAPLDTWVVVIGPGPDFRNHVHTLVPAGTALPGGLMLPAENAPLPRVFATGRTAVGGVIRGRTSGRPVSFIFVPVLREGRVIRALGMALDPARLAVLLQGQGLSGGAYATVVDSEGHVAARSRDHARLVGRAVPAWFRQATAGQPSGFFRGPGLEGEELVLGTAQIPIAPGWVVAVTEPWANYAASWWRPLAVLILGGLVVIGGGTLMALGLARRLARSVGDLASDARGLAAAAEGAGPPPAARPSGVTELDALRLGLRAAAAELRARALDKREAEDRRSYLMREVDHRAKNALAVALALIRLAPRDLPPGEFVTAVEGRVAAMARAHSVLASQSWNGAEMAAVAEGELAPYAGRYRSEGPPAWLAAEAVQPLAMLLHELATNAARHGALASPEGRVSVAWNFAADGGLRLHWSEQGGRPPPGEPQGQGFGSRLIKQLAERQLGGGIERDWTAGGLRLSLALPPRHAMPGGIPSMA
ncbi:HWE histidine kinase domain-containing protein [Falsiroseomonas sp. HC035]|uniref:HWE histidine kinase domain-containing protein n=1 Tax=Falsiroseomonas sp. HC035 TaxID=3390999 RepID=UPI003D31D197